MKKLLLFLFVPFIVSINSNAQNHYTIEGKNLKARINPAGDLFLNLDNFRSEFEIPKNSGKSTIYLGQIWVGGVDSATGQVVASAQTYRQSTSAWHPGPISDNFNGIYDDVFFGTNLEVVSHSNNFSNPAYTIPQNFLDWPAEGDLNNGEPEFMAPFIDINQNGTYDPANGDHPKIMGNSAAFVMANDIRDTVPFQGNPCCMGVDVYNYVYDWSYNDPALENTLFFKYSVVNRSARTYEDVYISMWMDADIGFAGDDYVGCDSAANMFFAYNGDNDDDTLGNGYGVNPPAQGFLFLDKQMSKFISYDNNPDSVNGNPTSDLDYYNYMSGKWRDGSNLTFGGDGTNQNNPPTNYMFSGNGWTEEALGNVPADRRLLGSIGPFKLSPGEKVDFDFALLFYWDSTQNNLTNRDSLIALSSQVANYYDSRVLSLGGGIDQNDIQVYPNPAYNSAFISHPANAEKTHVELVSVSGKYFEVKTNHYDRNTLKVDISEVPPGIYVLKIQNGDSVITKKIVKQ